MTARALDLEVLRNGRPLDSFQGHGDPEDIAWLQKRLQGWLEAHKWDKALWGQFEIVARDAGKNRQLAKARVA
jgi:hypothetical protein